MHLVDFLCCLLVCFCIVFVSLIESRGQMRYCLTSRSKDQFSLVQFRLGGGGGAEIWSIFFSAF